MMMVFITWYSYLSQLLRVQDSLELFFGVRHKRSLGCKSSLLWKDLGSDFDKLNNVRI